MIQQAEGGSGKTNFNDRFEYNKHAAASPGLIFDWAAVARKKWAFESNDFQRVLNLSTTFSTQVTMLDPAMVLVVALQPNSAHQYLVFPRKQKSYQFWCANQMFRKIISGSGSLAYGSETSVTQVVTDASLSEEFMKKFGAALSKISTLSVLEEGWDSYGANKINSNASESAVLLLRHLFASGQTEPPIVGPSPIGGVTLQWNSPNFEIFAELGPDKFEYYIDDLTGQNEFVEGSTTDLRELVAIIYQNLSDAAD